MASTIATASTRVLRQPRTALTCKRQLHTQDAGCRWHFGAAVVFDIDGVLVRGKQTIKEARRALDMLNGQNKLKRRIPFALLTNGGGVSEQDKASQISAMLGTRISANQVILAHSPMQALAAKYKDSHVLVVGGPGRQCADIAHAYGFRNVSTPNDIVAWRPEIWPFIRLSPEIRVEKRAFDQHPFAAVMVFHDSFDFGRDLQIVTDVLRSREGRLSAEYVGRQTVPLFLSNADLVFSNEYVRPRFGQGAFHECLRAMWCALTRGASLEYTRYGKPFAVQYRHAEQVLDALVEAQNSSVCEHRRIYAIGDNPAADIAGANAAGWTSILVRTGVFSGTNDPENPAQLVVDHVGDAVEKIIDIEHQRFTS
ncbi:hypothetical protein IWW36_001650 [Coemansia brasiliensis]|uniref:Uncharacterized protein n=1 Tax=Coemansia brasiliensis TaxID=2650707 RepID=A0A9W8M1T6_9FUNG|nr:hypothetical protein IWW36_001650 [Coemansia brasiliensis]